MEWNELRRWLSGDLEEITGELAYRTALRAFPLIANDLDRTWRSKVDLSPRLLNLFRGLLTMRVANDNPAEDYTLNLERIVQRCGSVDAYDYIPRAVRAACNLHTYPTRRDRYEELRKTLQAAKDGSRNIGMSAARHPKQYFALDTWAEVENDTKILTSKHGGIVPYVIADKTKVEGSWQDLSDHLDFYNEKWGPWLRWLEFRLFGHSSDGLSLSDWRAAEHQLANLEDEQWSTVSLLNNRFDEVLSNLVTSRDEEIEPDVESQNPVAILFAADETGLIDLDRSPTTAGLPGATDPLYLETLASANQFLDEPLDNSAALLRDRVTKYRDSLLHLHEASGAAVAIVRGESLRLLQKSYERGGDSLDLPPLTDQSMLSLNELVAHHNVMVSLHSGLANIDKMLAADRPTENLTSADLSALVDKARRKRLMTPDALSALETAVQQATDNEDVSSTLLQRASESARNLMRLAIKQLWTYKKALGTAIVAVPSALYAIGQWALANEAILTTYFRNRPGMHDAILRLFEWLTPSRSVVQPSFAN